MLIGLSGGADSVALLYILRACGYACEAAHCHFHLRGEESDRDARFVEQLCQEWQVPLHLTHFQTRQIAAEQGVSIEMAARDLRYAWFEELRLQTGAEAIAVAHHQNDQAETLLMHLSRGTGLRGMGGMRAKNGAIIRPLLCVTRNEIEAFCQTAHLSYITDSTNADTTIARNAWRALLQKVSETELHHIAEATERMQQYHDLLVALLSNQPVTGEAQHTLAYELLQPYGFRSSQVEDILAALPGSGKRIEAHDFTAIIDHGKLSLVSNPESAAQRHTQSTNTPESATPSQPSEDTNMPLLLRSVRPKRTKETWPKATDDWALVDADRLQEPLRLRHWREGDRFYPITQGRPICKKLQDFFTNEKLSLAEKEATWLLTSGEGEQESIVWIVGHRLDNRFKITEATTRVAEFQIEQS